MFHNFNWYIFTSTIFSPLYYYIIDHSKQHIPTNGLLQTELPKIGRQFSVDFNIQDNALSEDEGKFLDQLLAVR